MDSVPADRPVSAARSLNVDSKSHCLDVPDHAAASSSARTRIGSQIADMFAVPHSSLTYGERAALALRCIVVDVASDVLSALSVVALSMTGLFLIICHPHGYPLILILFFILIVMMACRSLYADRVRLGLMKFPLVVVYTTLLVLACLAIGNLISDEVAEFEWPTLMTDLGF